MRVDILNKDEINKVSDRLAGDCLILWQIGIATGLRISDILNIRAGQIKNKKRLQIREIKTGKKRKIYINNELKKEISRYIERHKIKDNDMLFKKSYTTYYRAIKKASEEIEKNVGTHSMRKSYAWSRLINKGYDMYTLQHCLNHDNIVDTINYTIPNAKMKGKRKKNGI